MKRSLDERSILWDAGLITSTRAGLDEARQEPGPVACNGQAWQNGAVPLPRDGGSLLSAASLMEDVETTLMQSTSAPPQLLGLPGGAPHDDAGVSQVQQATCTCIVCRRLAI